MATLRHGVVKQSLFWITRDSDTKDFVLLQVDLLHLEDMEDTKHPGIILNESTKLPNKPDSISILLLLSRYKFRVLPANYPKYSERYDLPLEAVDSKWHFDLQRSFK